MTPERLAQLDEVLLSIAEQISTMSLAKRAKVGAVIYKDNNILSMGWNGMPSGFPNEEIEIINEDGSLTTNPLVLHGESNAILKVAVGNGGADGSTLYCTFSPCQDCAKLIIQAKIKRVVYRTEYRISEGIEILRKAGIEVVKLLRPAEIAELARIEAEKQAIIETEKLAAIKLESEKPKYKVTVCPNCRGSGRNMLFFAIGYAPSCNLCSGSGKIKLSTTDGRIVP